MGGRLTVAIPHRLSTTVYFSGENIDPLRSVFFFAYLPGHMSIVIVSGPWLVEHTRALLFFRHGAHWHTY